MKTTVVLQQKVEPRHLSWRHEKAAHKQLQQQQQQQQQQQRLQQRDENKQHPNVQHMELEPLLLVLHTILKISKGRTNCRKEISWNPSFVAGKIQMIYILQHQLLWEPV